MSAKFDVIGYADSNETMYIGHWIMWHIMQNVNNIVVLLNNPAEFTPTIFLQEFDALIANTGENAAKTRFTAYRNKLYALGTPYLTTSSSSYELGTIRFINVSAVPCDDPNNYFSKRIAAFNYAWTFATVNGNVGSTQFYSFCDVRDFWTDSSFEGSDLSSRVSIVMGSADELRVVQKLYDSTSYESNPQSLTNQIVGAKTLNLATSNDFDRVPASYNITNWQGNPPVPLTSWPFKSIFHCDAIGDVVNIFVHKTRLDSNGGTFGTNPEYDANYASTPNPEDGNNHIKRVFYPTVAPEGSTANDGKLNPKFIAQRSNGENLTCSRYGPVGVTSGLVLDNNNFDKAAIFFNLLSAPGV